MREEKKPLRRTRASATANTECVAMFIVSTATRDSDKADKGLSIQGLIKPAVFHHRRLDVISVNMSHMYNSDNKT